MYNKCENMAMLLSATFLWVTPWTGRLGVGNCMYGLRMLVFCIGILLTPSGCNAPGIIFSYLKLNEKFYILWMLKFNFTPFHSQSSLFKTMKNLNLKIKLSNYSYTSSQFASSQQQLIYTNKKLYSLKNSTILSFSRLLN